MLTRDILVLIRCLNRLLVFHQSLEFSTQKRELVLFWLMLGLNAAPIYLLILLLPQMQYAWSASIWILKTIPLSLDEPLAQK